MQRKLLIVTCLLAIGTLAYAQRGKKDRENRAPAGKEQTPAYKEIGSELPPLRFYRRDGVYLTEKDLSNDAPLVIMLFNPTCDHCEAMTFKFEKHLDRFKKTNLILMAADRMGPYLSYFVANTRADKYPALQIGLDSSGFISKTFRYESLPQINVYDKDRKLIKVFTGEIPMDSLNAYIE